MLQIFHENHCLFQYLLFICFDFLVLMYLRTNLFVFLVKLCKIPIEIRVEIYFRFKKKQTKQYVCFFRSFLPFICQCKIYSATEGADSRPASGPGTPSEEKAGQVGIGNWISFFSFYFKFLTHEMLWIQYKIKKYGSDFLIFFY